MGAGRWPAEAHTAPEAVTPERDARSVLRLAGTR